MTDTMKQLVDNAQDDEVKKQLFYFIDKFRSLIKSYYRSYEKCEIEGGKDSEEMELLNKLYAQLQLLKN
jgi:hypothetical protein